ncbi:hypothetical protein [Sorangium sp. So ce426]|uniref:hypothetical protein n=1 Tax=Sorangium sp. So ce426 TaxID=3133312 RepID=UPI003F5AF9ED
MEAIFAERLLIRAVLIASGVPARHRADVEQQVLIGAWDSVRRGMYWPDPREDPRRAPRGWLHGIAWRKVSHHLGSSWVRRAVLHAEPLGLLRELAGPSLLVFGDHRRLPSPRRPSWDAGSASVQSPGRRQGAACRSWMGSRP